MSYCPQRDLDARLPNIAVTAASLAPARAAYVVEHEVIVLDKALEPAVRRSALAHEIAHLDLKHRPTGIPHFDARQERAADRLAARRLIIVNAFVDAILAGANDDISAAEFLDVDARTVETWRASLSSAEVALIQNRIARIEHAS